ncbi:MAG: hypothetical protein ACRD50_04685 [Candidatus Acidiferrales bacterium]
MERVSDILGVRDGRKFEVHCNARDAGELRVGSKSLSVKVGQRILRDGAEEMWDSVMIHGGQAADGSFEIRVMVFHPDWDQGRQIACIRSKPTDKPENAEMLAFDLVHCDV